MKFRRIQKAHVEKQSLIQSKYSGISELFNAETGLIGYNKNLVRMIKIGLEIQNDEGSILEFGAGTGTLAQIFQSGYGIKPHCLEIDHELIEILKNRGFSTFSSMNELTEKYQYIYTSNVLEHIESDQIAIDNIYAQLRKGGKIAIYVPAFPILFSELDRGVGHFRRYRMKDLLLKVESAGFTVLSREYSDSLGFFASLILKILGFNPDSGVGSERSLRFYDKYLYPISRIVDLCGFKYVLGKNIFIVGQRPD